MKILSKREMYALYQRGAFGNKLRTWSLEDYLASDFAGTVVLRYAGTGGGAKTVYHIPRDHVEAHVVDFEKEGLSRDRIQVNESAPDELLTIQGEVMRSTDHLTLRFSRAPQPMRVALKLQPEHAEGLRAQLLLQTYLSPASYDDLMELLDTYDGAVVEFSTFSVDVGYARGRNTVVWEVRHY